MTHIITGTVVVDEHFAVYILKNIEATVEEVLMECMETQYKS